MNEYRWKRSPRTATWSTPIFRSLEMRKKQQSGERKSGKNDRKMTRQIWCANLVSKFGVMMNTYQICLHVKVDEV